MAHSLMSHIINPTKEEGGQAEVTVSDDNVQSLLTRILQELKRMNIQLTLLTDNEVTKEEIE